MTPFLPPSDLESEDVVEERRERFIERYRNEIFIMKNLNMFDTDNKCSVKLESSYLFRRYHEIVAIIITTDMGIDLTEYLNKNCDKMSENDMRDLMTQLIKRVEFLHKKKIMHRDLKNDNFVIDNTGYVRVIDMGDSTMKAKSSSVHGTLFFMGDEMLHLIRNDVENFKYDYKIDYDALARTFEIMVCGITFKHDRLSIAKPPKDLSMEFRMQFSNLISKMKVSQVEKRGDNWIDPRPRSIIEYLEDPFFTFDYGQLNAEPQNFIKTVFEVVRSKLVLPMINFFRS